MQANTLGGGGVTLGNEQAQQDYAAELARAMADMQQAASQQGMAEQLQRPEYAQNSGALGSLAMIAQAYAGKKMAKRASADDADARTRYYKGESALKAQDEAAKEARAREQADRAAKEFNLSPEERKYLALNGKLPESRRDRTSVVMTNQGAAIVNNDDGTYRIAQPEGQRAPAGVQIDPSLPPEIQAAIAAHERNGSAIPDELNVTQQAQAPLMPYKDPAIAANQAATNERLDRADARDAERLRMEQERAQAAAAEAAKKANAPNAALDQWVEARKGLEEGLGRTDTGPLMGRLPALTTDQQIAEGSVAATAPILKQLFRTAGEGAFTDKDQELLMKMVPTRLDSEEARAAKIENIDRIIRAKLGAGSPQTDPRESYYKGPQKPKKAASGGVLKYNPKTGEFE